MGKKILLPHNVPAGGCSASVGSSTRCVQPGIGLAWLSPLVYQWVHRKAPSVLEMGSQILPPDSENLAVELMCQDPRGEWMTN